MNKKLKITLLADTDLTRELGLMCRFPLKKNECAFFDFKKSGKFSFWNKNVSFPISVIFCDEKFLIKDIGYLEENQLKPISSKNSNVRYVIEAHKDLPKELGLKINDKFTLENYEVLFDGKNS
jgi:uncharacterized membrane protein (UPF0127 family)